jgi:hypothetical protein
VRYPPALFGSATSAVSLDGVIVEPGLRKDHDRTAILVDDDTSPQVITLPDGGTFTWLPAGSTVAMLAEPALRIMVEGEDPARVLALADSLAALAAERLNQSS